MSATSVLSPYIVYFLPSCVQQDEATHGLDHSDSASDEAAFGTPYGTKNTVRDCLIYACFQIQ